MFSVHPSVCPNQALSSEWKLVVTSNLEEIFPLHECNRHQFSEKSNVKVTCCEFSNQSRIIVDTKSAAETSTTLFNSVMLGFPNTAYAWQNSRLVFLNWVKARSICSAQMIRCDTKLIHRESCVWWQTFHSTALNIKTVTSNCSPDQQEAREQSNGDEVEHG